ncbi:50S ribosomal protein L9 [Pelotomaculum propionicicum]|uniref:Large ribosomal subunit protein bL9 n=1 Tax=Pelotomaculum propionicicum TaxID=258475 RepID=A0A4Y7RY80_9FIRM|nr:50S ribosomal protein L9 [Pelotomaculum propionicicum]TEB13686.1 50S ribosomal protein L9 [Pelotomaculum propionicicum]
MKVILLKDVPGQGKRGDMLNVAEGYARNYLFPRGLAAEASKGKMNELAVRRQAQAAKEQKIEQEARELAASLDNLIVVVRAKAGEGGKLFGSVNNKNISDALAEQHKIVLDKKKLIVKEPIKQLGVYTATAKLHSNVHAEVKVEVVGD